MTSPTSIKKKRTRMKHTGAAKVRKRKLRMLGSTPPFAIDPKGEAPEDVKRREKIMSGR
jgi:hypothetical protein